MKFLAVQKLLLVVAFISAAGTSATPTPAATAEQGTATFVTSWVEDGLERYRFYTDVSDMNTFVHAFQNCGGITNNWQAWQQDGHGVFDDSEVLGIAGARVIACGIHAVTGQNCQDISDIGC